MTAKSLSGANGDATPNSLDTLVVSCIPVGATLSDGTGLPGHSFTATADDTSQDVASWNLSSLTITPPAEFEGCFKLTIAATEHDSEGDISATVTATEIVTVAPVARPPTASAPATLTLNENATCVAVAGVIVGPLAEDRRRHGECDADGIAWDAACRQPARGDGDRRRLCDADAVGERGGRGQAAGGADLYANRGVRGLRRAASVGDVERRLQHLPDGGHRGDGNKSHRRFGVVDRRRAGANARLERSRQLERRVCSHLEHPRNHRCAFLLHGHHHRHTGCPMRRRSRYRTARHRRTSPSWNPAARRRPRCKRSGQLENDGTLQEAANAAFIGPITNNGTIIVDPNVYLDVTGPITGIGKFSIDSGTTLEFAPGSKVAPGTTDSQIVYFEQGAGKLIIDDWGKFAGVITGTGIATHLTTTDLIDLTQLPYVEGSMSASVSYNCGTNISTITFGDGIGSNNVTLHFSGNYIATAWSFTSVNGGAGTEIVDPPTDSGTVTSGPTGEIAAASAATTDFANAGGINTSLTLDHGCAWSTSESSELRAIRERWIPKNVGIDEWWRHSMPMKSIPVQTVALDFGVLKTPESDSGNHSIAGDAGKHAAPMHGAGVHDFEPSSIAQVGSGGTVGTPGNSFHFKDEISGSKGSGIIDVAEPNDIPASESHHDDAAGTLRTVGDFRGRRNSWGARELSHFKDEISGSKGSRVTDVAELNGIPASMSHHEDAAGTLRTTGDFRGSTSAWAALAGAIPR